MGTSNPCVPAVSIAASIVWLSDGLPPPRRDPAADAGAGGATVLPTVATIDLLVADYFTACAFLPERLAGTVTRRFVDTVLRRIESTWRRRLGPDGHDEGGPTGDGVDTRQVEDPA
jgi:hypothetical protein